MWLKIRWGWVLIGGVRIFLCCKAEQIEVRLLRFGEVCFSGGFILKLGFKPCEPRSSVSMVMVVG